MTRKTGIAGMLAIAMAFSMPGVASADEVQRNAENIRKLDIMLMVTSLRCRKGADDFQPDYRDFTRVHLNTLNRAGRHLRAQFAGRYGAKGAVRALDRMSVGMANQFGQGHPWLECAELREVARDLARNDDPMMLSRTADDLLAQYPVSGSRYAVSR